eukprot:COSAG02_NODE_41796_length_391_cov_0.304795_1_plen_58_part_10
MRKQAQHKRAVVRTSTASPGPPVAAPPAVWIGGGGGGAFRVDPRRAHRGVLLRFNSRS